MGRRVPVHSGDFLGGGEGVRIFRHVAHLVEHLCDVAVFEEVAR